MTPKYPGVRTAMDGSSAVVAMETAASEAAGAYPITPSTQMGEGWALAVAAGETNVNGRRLLFFEPEGEHAAAAVTAGMSMSGLRATNFSSGQGIVYMHESLYPAVGKRLTYVLNVAARAITKHALNVHAGHDDYHAVDDTGFFQVFAKNVQESADFTLIAHRIAELSLNPGISAQDGFLTSHVIESLLLPERELIKEYLGDPSDIIETPTAAQKLVFGEKRRRIPELFDLDYPAMLGVVQNQDSYAQGVAAQRPFYFDHVADLADQAFAEFAELTGREYARASGYRLEDAEYVLAGQGSVVENAEAVADYLRAERQLKVGVLNLSMFRPFPADLVTWLLAGKKAVTVLERTDQPLAVDAPLLREIRAAMSKGMENARHAGALPHAGVASVQPHQMPDFYSAGFGFGSRDLQPGDIIAAVEHMVKNEPRRQYYLGIDFIRKDTRLPKLQLWQEKLLDKYPHIDELALSSAGDFDLAPAGAIALRMHSVGGWGAITTGKNLVMTAFELAGTTVKANPKYGSEKKGQPTTFFATLARDPIRMNCELKHVDVVLSPDPNVFRHSNALAGLSEGGVFIIQSDLAPADVWRALPASAQREAVQKKIRIYALDGFKIASDEASDLELRYRMQGAAFMGAFFKVSPFAANEKLSEAQLFDGIRAQMQKKFGKLGDRVVEDNLRVIRRGFDEVVEVSPADVTGDIVAKAVGAMPPTLDVALAAQGLANPGRFWEQVCSPALIGQDGIADPFAAVSVLPAATAAMRDMTGIRFEVPDFIPSKCTGCAQCWTQCPDSAIPGLVNSVEDVIDAAIRYAARDNSVDKLRAISKHLAKESKKVMDAGAFTTFGAALQTAFMNVLPKVAPDAAKQLQLTGEFGHVLPIVQNFPLAKTLPFYEKNQGLLSITVNPEACKGCNICVEVCPENALVTIKQDDAVVEQLRKNWAFWQELPDTDDKFINVRSIDEGIGVLPTLLLKKKTYRSMIGGDGACMGCGEKTSVHLVTSTIEAMMQPRVAKFVEQLNHLIQQLEEKNAPEHMPTLNALTDLRWRYTEGPGGRGRASLGMANSTGCSSVWGSTYPYNPYPFPWVNHLFQDAPSIAIGLFEGQMRKMADAFRTVRTARALLEGQPAPDLVAFDWRQFTDEEFGLCPPVIAMGGDGAMLDIGFQNLSRLMASGKPLRVIVLDTQVYSNTGGQACTSGFTGQVADMSAYGKAQHGKEEVRKELALIALAHRGTFVLQSSQASASHLISGLLKGLQTRRPAVFNIYTPCPVEHGLPDEWAPHSARMALESRAFPFLVYDPDAGQSVADCLSLDGNPALDEVWPTYALEYVDDDGAAQKLDLPLTIADWAATEARFKKHFRSAEFAEGAEGAEQYVAFAEFIALAPEQRAGKTPFIYTVDAAKKLKKLTVSTEMVQLATDRLLFWSQLKELAGLQVSENIRDSISTALQADYEVKLSALRAEYEAKISELRSQYPRMVARRLAEGLLGAGNRNRTVAELLESAENVPGLEPIAWDFGSFANGETDVGGREPVRGRANGESPATETTVSSATALSGSSDSATAVIEGEDDDLAIEAYIETARCTSCNECTNLNSKMFAYDANKQAYIKDVKAGTFAQLVTAAERCPAGLIHPGTPVNPNEKDLEKWVKRAEAFA